MIKPFKKTWKKDEILFFDFLRENILFHNLTNKELSKFIPTLHLRRYKRNEVVFFRSDPSQAIYIMKSGTVRLFIDTFGKEEDLVNVSSGYVFGQNAIIPRAKRLYTAQTISEKAELYVLPKVSLFEVFNKNVEIKAKVYETLSCYYSDYISNTFKAYRQNFGFFQLSQIYNNELYDPKDE